jgi:hypothetical protein
VQLLKRQQSQLQQEQRRTWDVSACTAVAIAHVWGDTQNALLTNAANTHHHQQHGGSVSPNQQDISNAIGCRVQCRQWRFQL